MPVLQFKNKMSFLVYSCAILIFASYVDQTSASFLYGQPCSDRNTAYLYVTTWRLPGNPGKDPVNCVDVTGLSKTLTSNITLLNYTRFFELVSDADTLYADHMNLKRFPIVIVHALPQLELIDMSSNNITRLPQKMYKIAPRMTKLLLADNRVTIPRRKPLMSSQTLKTLMLSDNRIRNVYKYTFARLPALELLYLDRNEITYISPTMFSPMKSLKYLHLGQNYLSKVPPKNFMPKSITHYITKSQGLIRKRSLRRRSRKLNHQ